MVYNVCWEQMDKLEDLLPGIEDYLSKVLANETLSEYAEEQRQYFLERLDIIKLPPSIPPRPRSLGVRLYPLHSSPPLSSHDSLPSSEQDDFAAYQRELSRALQGDTPTSPDVSEVKVYDDIDTTDGSLDEIKPSKVEDEESMYEIPQLQRTLSDSGYEKALELSPLSKSASSEEQLSGQSGPPMPPPLPPRGERAGSDAASRGSVGSLLEERISDTPVFRTKLNRESSVPARLENSMDSRSEKSSDDLLDEDYDGASCDSLDDIGSLTRGKDPESRIQLPRPVKRKHIAHHRKLGKSLSSLWEITQPFGMLEDVVMSGELHYRSKLTWTRKIVALTNGRLVCYKVDKTDSRPSFVILLTGYIATFHKREGRRSFEIHLDHDNFESYVFLVDFKEWAVIWCEHINAAAKGQRVPGPVIHLARNSMIANPDGTYHMANSNVQLSNSNASLVSSDGFEVEQGQVKMRKKDPSGVKTVKIGAFASKASQFFESLGKRSSFRKSAGVAERSPSVERVRQLSCSQSSLSEVSEKLSQIIPESNIEESVFESPIEMKKHIKHQGYVDVYSSFNKRKWGKRWCLVHENNFECYRTQTSEVCELEFLLRNCILKRAIKETKSELGLMLLENDREKITIEPINWTELGSWLRVLMQETSTQKTPEGLEGYMDDTHPYHEAVEITRVPDPINRTSSLSVRPRGQSTASFHEEQKKSMSHDNRDIGICSSESNDDRFNSLDRNLNSPKVHPCFTDSSLPRVSVCDTGDIYTQVKRPSVTVSSSSSPTTGSKSNCNKTTDNYRKSDETSRKSDDDNLFFDFEIDTFCNSSHKRGSSLVEEIMSELMIQHDNNKPLDNTDEQTEFTDNKPDSYTIIKRQSKEFSPTVNDISPIKAQDVTVIEREFDFLCSSFDDNEQVNSDSRYATCDNREESAKFRTCSDHKTPSVKRHPSNVSVKINVTESLEELRTRLVQLKKDRISIRDRKQQISSERDKEFLEAEYERLDRECKKVAEEIKQLEQPIGKDFDDNERKSNLDKETPTATENKKKILIDDSLETRCNVCASKDESDSCDTVRMKEQFNDIVSKKQTISSTTAVKQHEGTVSTSGGFSIDAVVKEDCDSVIGNDNHFIKPVEVDSKECLSNNIVSKTVKNEEVEGESDTEIISNKYDMKQLKGAELRPEDKTSEYLETSVARKEELSKHCIDTVSKTEVFKDKQVVLTSENYVNEQINVDEKNANFDTISNNGSCSDQIVKESPNDLEDQNTCDTSVAESVCDKENVPNIDKHVKEVKDINN